MSRKPVPPKPPEKPVVGNRAGSAKARKSAARLAAVQALYQMLMSEQSAKDILKSFEKSRIGFELDGDVMVPADLELLEQIVTGVEARRHDVSALIAGARGQDDGEKLEPLLRAILLAGAYELLSHKDLDSAIIINDYVNVSHAFYEDAEPGLVNAVLDKIAQVVRS